MIDLRFLGAHTDEVRSRVFEDLYGRASSDAGYFSGYETRSGSFVLETARLALELGVSHASKLHDWIESGLITKSRC
jgi:hypothetical protein